MTDSLDFQATIGTGELSRLLDVTPQRVSQLTTAGVFERVGRGRYQLGQVVTAYVRYLRDRPTGTDGAGIDYAAERARLTRAQADHAELELAQLRREVIPIADVTAGMTDAYSAVRAHLLALPSKLAPQLEMVAARQAFDVLTRGVRESLQELVDRAEAELRDMPADDQ